MSEHDRLCEWDSDSVMCRCKERALSARLAEAVAVLRAARPLVSSGLRSSFIAERIDTIVGAADSAPAAPCEHDWWHDPSMSATNEFCRKCGYFPGPAVTAPAAFEPSWEYGGSTLTLGDSQETVMAERSPGIELDFTEAQYTALGKLVRRWAKPGNTIRFEVQSEFGSRGDTMLCVVSDGDVRIVHGIEHDGYIHT